MNPIVALQFEEDGRMKAHHWIAAACALLLVGSLVVTFVVPLFAFRRPPPHPTQGRVMSKTLGH